MAPSPAASTVKARRRRTARQLGQSIQESERREQQVEEKKGVQEAVPSPEFSAVSHQAERHGAARARGSDSDGG